MKRALEATVLFFTFLSCADTDKSAFNDIDKKAVIDSVRQTLYDYFANVKRHGLVGEFKYLDSSPDFFWVPPRYSSAISYDSVAAILNRYQASYSLVDNTWEQLKVSPINNELASYTGRIRSVTTDSSGKQSIFTLMETGLAIRRKDGWKLLNGQTSVIENHSK